MGARRLWWRDSRISGFSTVCRATLGRRGRCPTGSSLWILCRRLRGVRCGAPCCTPLAMASFGCSTRNPGSARSPGTGRSPGPRVAISRLSLSRTSRAFPCGPCSPPFRCLVGTHMLTMGRVTPPSVQVGLFDSSDVPSWSVPRVVLSQSDGDLLPKVVANKMIVLSSGEWVLPFWRERPDVEMYSCMKGVADEPSSGVLISEDEGQSWTAHGVLHDTRSPLLEGTVVELASKDILMLLRSSTGCMWRSMSKDQGRTWSEPEPTRLPNPNSKVHMIRLQNSSHLVLAFNNHKKFGTHLPTAEAGEGTQCRACRTALSLAISTNDGISWRVVASVDMDLTPGIRIHYPTLQQVDDTLLVTYSKFYLYRDPGEWSSDQGIRVASFNISKLLSTLAQDQVLRSIPSRGALLRMVDHFIEKLTPAEEAFIQTKGFRGTSAKKSERRWRWLAAALSNRYDLEHLGGLQWLVKKSNFAQYASGRVWSPERMQTAHANMSAATLRQADIAPTDIE
mmetsp:Transcript_19155/g.53408  ORF Transcript_19155/g.53408 Transcript_19155/m.53408 type:complete len:508 (-) Transcript_19155:188-1711(-)